MKPDAAVARALAADLVNHVEQIVLEAETESRPLEVDPAREGLFALFTRAWEAGLIDDEVENQPDLTADGLCQTLAARWGLGDATRESVARQERLAPTELAKMRLLWSLLRMWMEWTYAWQRWGDFH